MLRPISCLCRIKISIFSAVTHFRICYTNNQHDKFKMEYSAKRQSTNWSLLCAFVGNTHEKSLPFFSTTEYENSCVCGTTTIFFYKTSLPFSIFNALAIIRVFFVLPIFRTVLDTLSWCAVGCIFDDDSNKTNKIQQKQQIFHFLVHSQEIFAPAIYI